MAALTLVLVALMIRDLIGTPPGEGGGIDSADVDTTPRLALHFDYGTGKDLENTMRFGLEALDPQNAHDPNPKRLTYDKIGRTNSTVAQIDGVDRMLGKEPYSGKWMGKPANSGLYGGKAATFQFTPDRIFVTQTVEIRPGESYETASGVFKQPLNTCVVRYKVANQDARTHKIGLRVMIDTLIGANDGVPFTIPGDAKLVNTFKDFRDPAEIPDFIQALEVPDLEHPGTIVQMNLKLSKELAPDRVSLTYWPGRELGLGRWEVPLRNIADDSAIVLYWNPVDMRPGAVRDMAFSYGLGRIQGGKLGLTVGGTLAVNRDMTVIAYVADPQPDETATLKLPDGFEFRADSPATQPVPPAERGPDGKLRPSPVTWLIRPTLEGRRTLIVTTSTQLSVSQPVTIRAKGIF
jgi:hypothetical protein